MACEQEIAYNGIREQERKLTDAFFNRIKQVIGVKQTFAIRFINQEE